ncbi:MAG: YkgJ family cysteine cluster protein [Planctomycetes bacterium]|nr:YkgJ family cysteine cluster protein [Planctomycetota bacterium]
MTEIWHFDIAGLSIPLHEVQAVLAELQAVYDLFHRRGQAFKADGRNPHLCRAGCSHCCQSGAIFAVTLAEAVPWSRAIEALPADQRQRARQEAASLVERQHQAFAEVPGPADVPGRRDEALFSARVSKLNATGPACPLLVDDLCAVYADRPFLCRAYGFPVDAYSVEGGGATVFRSLCVLYDGMELSDYVRAKDLKAQLVGLSRRLGGGRDWGRFTAPEAILARVEPASSANGAPQQSAHGGGMTVG